MGYSSFVDFKKLKLCLKDGDSLIGIPININYADDTGRDEDEIAIETEQGEIFSIKYSEIETIIPLEY